MAPPYKSPYSNASSNSTVDNSLVAEQGGLSTSLIGIVIAIVIGMVVRGALAPEKIKTRLSQAIARIGEGVEVSFVEASVSLSRGIFPDLALVIRQAHLSALKKCWGSPDAEINELRFPISVLDALAGKPFVHRVDVDRVVLLLRNEPGVCTNDREVSVDSSINTEESLIRSLAAEVSKGTSQTRPALRPDIRSLNINHLRINYLPLPFTSLEFTDFDADIESLEPQRFHLSTGLDLGGETLSGDYASHGRIHLDFDENHTSPLTGTLRGSWREGRFEMDLQADPKAAELAMSGELMHIPLSQVFPLLKKYKLMLADMNGKQTWLSTKFSTKGKYGSGKSLPLYLQDFKVEGDLGEISLEKAEFSDWSPLRFAPLKFRLKDFDLDQVLVFLSRPHPTPALGRLGVFDGVATFNEKQEAQIAGLHRRLELIFSNKGSREIQNIESFVANLNFSDEKWAGEVREIHLQGGDINGDIRLTADRNWRDLRIKANMQKLNFDKRVENLMTQGGQARELALRLEAYLAKGELKKLNGYLSGEKIEIEGVQLTKPKVSFSNQGDEFEIDVLTAGGRVANLRSFDPIWSKINQESSNLDESLVLKRVSGKFRTLALQNFSWSGIEIISDNFALSSSGGWDAANNLHGIVSLRDKGKLKKWKLSGQRAQPIFTKD